MTRLHPHQAARRGRIFALVGITCIVIAVAALVALHAIEPGLGPIIQPLSYYARGHHVLLWQLALTATGASALALAVGASPHASRRVGVRALTLAGIALPAVAAFPTDPWFPWEHTPTTMGVLHLTASALLIVTLAVALTAGIRLERSEEGLERWRLTLGRAYVVILAVSTVAVTWSAASSRPPLFIGLAERILVAIGWAWLAILAAQLLRADHRSTRSVA